MPFRLIADAAAQTTIPLALGSGATSFVGQATAAFTSPQSFGNGQGSLTILDRGNPAWNDATPLATPYEYAYYTNNNTGTNTISGLTRGVAGTTAKNFNAGAIVAQAFLAEDLIASAPWKFDEQSPSSVSTITIPASGSIPASYLGINFRHVVIEWLIRSTASALNADLWFQLNGDATAAYIFQTLSGSNGSASYTNPSGSGVTTASIGIVPAASMVSGLFGHGTIKFTDYTQSVAYHLGRGESHFLQAGTTTSAIYLRTASWNAFTPITAITLGLGSGNFLAGSRITTYLWP